MCLQESHFKFLHKSTLEQLLKKTNFFHLGYKDHIVLPSYLKAFQVGLIPFALKKVTESVVPYKLFEYLAAGCPVVATPLPDLMRYRHVIEVAETKEDFSRAIQNVLINGNKKLEQRIQFARENSWKSRTDDINTLLLKLIRNSPKT